MLERHVVAGTPGELGAKAGVHAVLIVALRGDVSDFLLRGLEHFNAGVHLVPLEHGHGVDVTDVAHGLKLVQMGGVVHEVQHEVVLHGDVEGLHLLAAAAGFRDSGFDSVLGLHELFVLSLDLVDDAWGVDGGAVAVPVNVLLLDGSLSFVVVVKDTRKLTVGVTGGLIVGSTGNSLQPVSSEVLAYHECGISLLKRLTYF
jgi:hypothetical protein